MSDYLKQKLFQALHDLVAAGDIDERLTHASNYLVHLQEPDIPKEYRAEAAAIKKSCSSPRCRVSRATCRGKSRTRMARSWHSGF